MRDQPPRTTNRTPSSTRTLFHASHVCYWITVTTVDEPRARLLPMALVTDAKTVEISCLSKERLGEEKSPGKASLRDDEREWNALSSIIDPLEHNPSTITSTNNLGHYVSSPNRNRWFCTNCGTPFAYSVTHSAYPEPWKAANVPRMFDIWLGTLDSEVLANEWMRPDHAFWCHFGIPWVSELAKTGAGRLVGNGERDTEEKGEGDGVVKDRTRFLGILCL